MDHKNFNKAEMVFTNINSKIFYTQLLKIRSLFCDLDILNTLQSEQKRGIIKSKIIQIRKSISSAILIISVGMFTVWSTCYFYDFCEVSVLNIPSNVCNYIIIAVSLNV